MCDSRGFAMVGSLAQDLSFLLLSKNVLLLSLVHDGLVNEDRKVFSVASCKRRG